MTLLDFLSIPIVQTILKIVVIVLVFVMALGTLLTLLERKWSSAIQDRIGPNRANIGPFRFSGLFHLLTDAIKSIAKEDTIPQGADRVLFFLAPLFGFLPAMVVWAVIPFAGPIGAFTFQITDINAGLVFIFAITSLGVYGAVLAGYASNNKFGMLGAMRTSSQMLSYEVFLGLSLLGVFMVYGSVQVGTIVANQNTYWFDGLIPKWGIFTQPVAFVLFFTAMLAEGKRQPFDQPEGESEIVAGYNIEYSGMRFGAFMLAEFTSVATISGVVATLFLGGYNVPWLYADGFHLMGYQLLLAPFAVAVIQIMAFIAKVLILCWFIIVIRWTLPRFRFDQVMDLGWKVLLPMSMANVVVTAVVLLWL